MFLIMFTSLKKVLRSFQNHYKHRILCIGAEGHRTLFPRGESELCFMIYCFGCGRLVAICPPPSAPPTHRIIPNNLATMFLHNMVLRLWGGYMSGSKASPKANIWDSPNMRICKKFPPSNWTWCIYIYICMCIFISYAHFWDRVKHIFFWSRLWPSF